MLYNAFHEKVSSGEEKSNINRKKTTKGRGKKLFTKIK